MSHGRLMLLLVVLVACSADTRRPSDGGAGDMEPDAVDATTDARPTDARPDAQVCETLSAGAEPVPATLLLQVDTSNSMNCPAGDPGCLTTEPTPEPDDSRWDVFTTELLAALESVPDATTIGLMRFPEAERACAQDRLASELAPLAESRATLLSAIAAITPDGLATPTHDGVAFALQRLAATDAERPFLVLATDGNASVCLGCDADCGFDSPEPLERDAGALVMRVEAAAVAGTPTFVIGVPGSQGFRAVLSRLARAGATARDGCSDTGPTFCHYDLTDPGLDFGVALRDALASIGDAVLGCEYDIPPNPDGTFDPARVNVRIRTGDTEETVPRDEARASGWDYSDSMDRIELFGDACVRAQGADTLEIAFGCPTVLI